jgi:ATP-dependent helicase HrpA
MKKEKVFFRAAKDREVMLFPGSGLFKNPGSWIVAAEMVETSRLFARKAAVVDVAWLEPLGGDLCRPPGPTRTGSAAAGRWWPGSR